MIRDEETTESNIVIVPMHVQIRFQSLKSTPLAINQLQGNLAFPMFLLSDNCEGGLRSVQETQQIKTRQSRKDTIIKLANKCLFLLGRPTDTTEASGRRKAGRTPFDNLRYQVLFWCLWSIHIESVRSMTTY
jgi:hypothetical protein